jgi:hypothetical protein
MRTPAARAGIVLTALATVVALFVVFEVELHHGKTKIAELKVRP